MQAWPRSSAGLRRRLGVLAEPDRLANGIAGRDVEAGLRELVRGRVRGQASPLRDDPRQLADLELRPLVAEERQGESLAAEVGKRDVDGEQAFLEERGAE